MTALLITLMSVAPYHVDGMPIDLHLVITRDGKLFFSNSGDTHWPRTEIQELTPLVGDVSKNTVERKVYLEADARCRYADVEIAVEQLSAAGISNLVMLTENPAVASTSTP